MRRAVAGVVLLALGLLGLVVPAGPAAASSCTSTLGGDAAQVGCETGDDGGSTPGSGASGGGAASPYRYRYVLTCLGNTVEQPTEALCNQATTTCTAPALFYWQYRSTDGVAWALVGVACLTPAEAAEGEEFPGFTLADFQRLPLPAGEVVLEPGNGYALAQVPLNAVAVAEVTMLTTELAGFAVAVRATPVSWTWDFGDGTTLGPTADPGAAYPDLGLTHTYVAGGAYAVTLTTTYAGEFSVDGGAFVPVAGTADVVAAPVPVEVLTGRGALVQDSLA